LSSSVTGETSSKLGNTPNSSQNHQTSMREGTGKRL